VKPKANWSLELLQSNATGREQYDNKSEWAYGSAVASQPILLIAFLSAAAIYKRISVALLITL